MESHLRRTRDIGFVINTRTHAYTEGRITTLTRANMPRLALSLASSIVTHEIMVRGDCCCTFLVPNEPAEATRRAAFSRYNGVYRPWPAS